MRVLVLRVLLPALLALVAACGAATTRPLPTTSAATMAPETGAGGGRLLIGTMDPGVAGPRHYPDWAYEPDLLAAPGVPAVEW